MYWRGRKCRREDLRNPKRHHHVEKLRLVFGYFSSVVSAGIQVRLVGLNDDAWAEIMKRRVLPMACCFLSSAKHLFRSVDWEENLVRRVMNACDGGRYDPEFVVVQKRNSALQTDLRRRGTSGGATTKEFLVVRKEGPRTVKLRPTSSLKTLSPERGRRTDRATPASLQR